MYLFVEFGLGNQLFFLEFVNLARQVSH